MDGEIQKKDGWVLVVKDEKVAPRLWVSPDGEYARVYQSKYYKGWADSRGKASKCIGGLSPCRPEKNGIVKNQYWSLLPPGMNTEEV